MGFIRGCFHVFFKYDLMIFIKDKKHFVFVRGCVKTPSKYVMTFLLRTSGRKNLLINAEKATGPKEIPYKSLSNSYCWFPITNCVIRRDCSSSSI